MVEDCPIIVNTAAETKIVGKGWVVCTPIRSSRGPLGMLYNDAGLTGAAVDAGKQARAAVLCSVVGLLLDAMRRARGGAPAWSHATRHPAVARAVMMLEQDPSLGGRKIAKELDVGLSRFARVFKAEMGLSLVAYRNQLRLDRFLTLMDAGSDGNLLETALAAGFGSYAQFHRVFVSLRGKTPRDYLARTGRKGDPRSKIRPAVRTRIRRGR